MSALRRRGRSARPLLGAVVAAAAVLAAAAAAPAAPYVPADDAVVLERLPPPGDPRVREARALARDLAARPEDVGLAAEVARRYVALGRAEGDPRYFGLAQGALGPWWSADEPPAGVRLLRADVRRARHDFDGALADLDALLAADPGNVQAHLDRATLLEALGDFRGAEGACARVARLRPGLVARACLASAGSLSGLARSSYDALAAALDDARSADDDEGVRLWALTILGEIAARLGDPAAAERHFAQALALGRRDVYLLAAYADLLLDRGRHAEAAALLEDESGVDGLVLRRALALHHLGDPAAGELSRDLQARFRAVRLRGDVPHLRDEARFALALQGDPERALGLARRNWRSQRGPADARVFLEAALAARAPEAARPVLDWMRATRIEDAALSRLAERLEGVAL